MIHHTKIFLLLLMPSFSMNFIAYASMNGDSLNQSETQNIREEAPTFVNRIHGKDALIVKVWGQIQAHDGKEFPIHSIVTEAIEGIVIEDKIFVLKGIELERGVTHSLVLNQLDQLEIKVQGSIAAIVNPQNLWP